MLNLKKCVLFVIMCTSVIVLVIKIGLDRCTLKNVCRYQIDRRTSVDSADLTSTCTKDDTIGILIEQRNNLARLLNQKQKQIGQLHNEMSVDLTSTCTRNVTTNILIEKRNNLVRLLNQKQKQIGQMECEKLRTNNGRTESGGWCNKTSGENSGFHVTDKSLAKVLAVFLTGKTVASFGDGPGRYKQLILDADLVKSYDAYDGAPYCEQTSEGRVTYLDLTLPQFGLPVYDWVISLEVAEHIPAQYENIYIDNIVRHAKEGVILSWALPGQPGFYHVNNKPFEYVKELFKGLGFDHDPKESQKMRANATNIFLKQNVNIYRRKLSVNIYRKQDTLEFNIEASSNA